jgi:hypothetical protein
MAISVVQTATGTGNPPVTFASNVTAGNTVILAAPCYDTGGTNNTVSSVLLGGSAVTGTVAFFNPGSTGGVNSGSLGGNVAYISIWMLPNCPGGQNSVDYTFSGSQVGQVAWEIAGLGTSPSLDQSSSGSSTTLGTSDSGTTSAITAAPEIVIGAAMIFSGAGASSPAGYTVSNPTGDLWAGYQIVTSSGGTYDWQQTGAGQPWAAAIVTIQGTAAAPAPVQVVLRAPYRPPPPPAKPPAQFITGQLPAPPAALAGVVQGILPYQPPAQVAPQAISTPAQPGAVTGQPAALALAAPAGSVTASPAVTGTTAALAFAAPAGTVSASPSVAGVTAQLTLAAIAGTAGNPATPGTVAISDQLNGTVTITNQLNGTVAISDQLNGTVTIGNSD